MTRPAAEIAQGKKRSRGRCHYPQVSCVIDASGSVFPCEYLRFDLGDINATPLADIITGPRYQSFMRRYEEVYSELEICDTCCRWL